MTTGSTIGAEPSNAAMAFSPGTRLGPYEIQAPLGAGDMGEVYRLRDTRLGRDVAIKALPAEVAQDGERLIQIQVVLNWLEELKRRVPSGVRAL